MLFQFCFLLVLIIPSFSLESNILGTWESVDTSGCVLTIHIGVNTFKQYADGSCSLADHLIGSYYVSDDMIVFRVTEPVMDIPSILYYYSVDSADVLTLLDKNENLIDVLQRKNTEHLLDGVWDGNLVTTLLFITSNTYQGRAYYNAGDLFYYYGSNQEFGRILSWNYNAGTQSGTIKQDYYSSINLLGTGTEQITGGPNSFSIKGQTILSTTTSKVNLLIKRSNDLLNGHYYYLDSTTCNHYLELTDGFYVEIVSGNTNCDNPRVNYGIYTITDATHVTLKIGNSAEKNVQFNTSNGLVLDNIQYVVAEQQVRNLTRTQYVYETSLLSLIIDLLDGVLNLLLGLSISPNEYDVIETGLLGLKRYSSEAEIVIHYPYDQNNGGEVIGSSSSSQVISIPTASSSTSTTYSGSSSSSSTYSNSGSTSSSTTNSGTTSSNSGSSSSSNTNSGSTSSNSGSSSGPSTSTIDSGSSSSSTTYSGSTNSGSSSSSTTNSGSTSSNSGSSSGPSSSTTANSVSTRSGPSSSVPSSGDTGSSSSISISSGSNSISYVDPSTVSTSFDNTVSRDDIHIEDGHTSIMTRFDLLLIVAAVAFVLVLVTASAVVYIKCFLQDTR